MTRAMAAPSSAGPGGGGAGSKAGRCAAQRRRQIAFELRQHVVGAFGEMGAAADEIVGAAAARIERRARHGEDFAALLQRKARGDERARAERRLHHQHAQATPKRAVAAREMARLRLGAERHLGDDGAQLGDERHEIAVLLGIDNVDAAATTAIVPVGSAP